MRMLLVLATVFAPYLGAQDCSTMMRDTGVRDLVAALNAVAAVSPIWTTYTIANHPVVLVSQSADTVAPACAAIWRYRREPLVIAIPRRIRLSTPLYGMWNGDPVGPRPTPGNEGIVATLRPLPREVEDSLRAFGETRAVVLPAPLRLQDLGAFGKGLQAIGIKPTLMLTQLAVHESYHLHSQFPTWLDQPRRYEWPAWDTQPDRKVLVQRCYGETPAVADLRQRELASLLEAWDLLKANSDSMTRTRARSAAREFIARRRERYALLSNVKIPAPVTPVSCAHAEDVMELEEGIPQWIGYITAQRAGLMDVDHAGRSANESFYVSGAFQLWIMERLIGEQAMRSMSEAIARSTQPDGPNGAVFGRFAALMHGR